MQVSKSNLVNVPFYSKRVPQGAKASRDGLFPRLSTERFGPLVYLYTHHRPPGIVITGPLSTCCISPSSPLNNTTGAQRVRSVSFRGIRPSVPPLALVLRHRCQRVKRLPLLGLGLDLRQDRAQVRLVLLGLDPLVLGQQLVLQAELRRAADAVHAVVLHLGGEALERSQDLLVFFADEVVGPVGGG